jgi:hypothetical protein
VALTTGRKPYYRLVSDASATTTSENHIFNYANFTSSDNLENIGYFEATLSAGAGYTWTVPTFTNSNLRNAPTTISRRMSYQPVLGGFSGSPTIGAITYQISNNRVRIDADAISGTSNNVMFTITSPFLNSSTSTYQGVGGYMTDNGSALTVAGRVGMAGNVNSIDLNTNMASGAWTNSGTKGAYLHVDHYI